MATPIKVNRIGLEPAIYKGGKTTLCAGCGHNAISERIIDAFYEMGVDPKQVIKLSGIGCSSKSPAYFLGGSHGFNAVHGRMPSVGTGAMLANHKLIAIGISGDGDTGAIGIGQFVHLMRRNLPIIYIIEDNGCYGLTKGQFSPTADLGSKLKTGVVNDLPPIDTCALAIELVHHRVRVETVAGRLAHAPPHREWLSAGQNPISPARPSKTLSTIESPTPISHSEYQTFIEKALSTFESRSTKRLSCDEWEMNTRGRPANSRKRCSVSMGGRRTAVRLAWTPSVSAP
jgi:hypothetical protein